MRTVHAISTALALAIAAQPLAFGALAQSTDGDATVSPAETPYDSNTVVATVNGTEITLGHLALLFDRLPAQYREIPDEALYEGILEQIVDQQVLSEQQGDDLPASVERTLENERRGLLARLTIDDLTSEEDVSAEIETAYKNIVDGTEVTLEYNASHILVETEEEAQALVAELEGGADFAELAKEKSTGPSGPNGGSLGWFGKGSMVPAFEEAIVELEVGAVSTPVKTRFGWHVIKMNDTREQPVPTLEEMRPTLENQVRQDKLRRAVEGLRAGADIEILDTGIPVSAIRDRALLED